VEEDFTIVLPLEIMEVQEVVVVVIMLLGELVVQVL
jgi:hypothetical protein